MRAAVIGGVAHHAGKVAGERSAEQQAQQAAAEPPAASVPDDAEAGPAPGEAAPPAPPTTDIVAQLTGLKSLLDSGTLTQAEFDTEKAKILARS